MARLRAGINPRLPLSFCPSPIRVDPCKSVAEFVSDFCPTLLRVLRVFVVNRSSCPKLIRVDLCNPRLLLPLTFSSPLECVLRMQFVERLLFRRVEFCSPAHQRFGSPRM